MVVMMLETIVKMDVKKEVTSVKIAAIDPGSGVISPYSPFYRLTSSPDDDDTTKSRINTRIQATKNKLSTQLDMKKAKIVEQMLRIKVRTVATFSITTSF